MSNSNPTQSKEFLKNKGKITQIKENYNNTLGKILGKTAEQKGAEKSNQIQKERRLQAQLLLDTLNLVMSNGKTFQENINTKFFSNILKTSSEETFLKYYNEILLIEDKYLDKKRDKEIIIINDNVKEQIKNLAKETIENNNKDII